MQFKGIFYSVAGTTGAAFMWTVTLATRELKGVAPNRTLAKLNAIKDQRQTKAAIRKAERERQ